MKSLLKNNIRFVLILYIIVLLLVNVLPINGQESALNNNYILHIRWDYLGHIVLFIPLFPLIYLNANSQLQQITINSAEGKLPSITRSKLLLITLSFLFAISTEFLQKLTPWRTFNINDLAANAMGVGIGTLGIISIMYFNKTMKSTY